MLPILTATFLITLLLGGTGACLIVGVYAIIRDARESDRREKARRLSRSRQTQHCADRLAAVAAVCDMEMRLHDARASLTHT